MPFSWKSSIPSIEARAAVNQRDDFGQSALWLACRFGRRDHVNPLLKAKVPWVFLALDLGWFEGDICIMYNNYQ